MVLPLLSSDAAQTAATNGSREMSARVFAILFAALLAMPAQAQTNPHCQARTEKHGRTGTGRCHRRATSPMAPISADIISPRLVEATKRMEEKNDPKAMALAGGALCQWPRRLDE